MAEQLTIVGYHYSVYTRIVRMALAEMGLKATYVEVNPFATPPDPVLNRLTDFDRVPVLKCDDFTLTETAAIVRYLDHLSDRPTLIPRSPNAAARMAQVIGIIDGYGYVPLVRQVFSHAVFRPMMGEPSDPAVVLAGLAAAEPVLRCLDNLAHEGLILNGTLSLADLHLAPMLCYFDMAPEGRAALQKFEILEALWFKVKGLQSLRDTDPFAAVPR